MLLSPAGSTQGQKAAGEQVTVYTRSGAKMQSGFQTSGASALSATPALSRAWDAGHRGLRKMCQKGYGPMQFSGLPIFNMHRKNITKHIKSVTS